MSISGQAPDWLAWHDQYAEPTSGLAWRLATIQGHIRAVLDDAPAGPVRVISFCAGQGRDIIGAVADHARRGDVTARLVELDPRNVEIARMAAAKAGLTGFEVVLDDASRTTAYRGAVPADLVLVCGVFGNVSDADVRRTVYALPGLSQPGATVIWTRHRHDPDLTVEIRRWFLEAGFAEVAFDRFPSGFQTVGVHRLVEEPSPYQPGQELFRFIR